MSHRSPTGRLFVAAFFVVLVRSAPAAADPITVSSGFISFQRQDQTRFSLAWSGGSLFALAGDSSNGDDAAPWPAYACDSCAAGASLNPSLDQEWTIHSGEGPFLQGSFVANGTAYTLKSLKVTIDANPTTIPAVPAGDNSTRAASEPSPFMMRAQLIGMANDINSSLLALTLFGRGNASVMFARDAPGLPEGWFSTQYRFSQPSTPTPEPGTLLLITGGIGALLARRRKARQAAA